MVSHYFEWTGFNLCYLKLELLDFFKSPIFSQEIVFSFLTLVLKFRSAQLYMTKTIFNTSNQFTIAQNCGHKRSQVPSSIHRHLLQINTFCFIALLSNMKRVISMPSSNQVVKTISGHITKK